MKPKAIKTSVGMETPNQTAERAKALLTPTQPTAPDLTSGIPASQVDTKAPSLNIPEVTPLPDTAGEAKSFGQSYLQNLQAEAQKRLQTAEAPITEGERNIRELMGIVGNESATRTQLETQAGIPDIQEKMRQAEQSISNQIAAIDDFDDSTAFDTEKMRIDASKRDLTKGTFGAQAAEFNLQRAIQRRGQAAQLRATIAGNLALQGNFAAATEQVDKALKSIYDPIKNELQLEKFFLERNDKRYESAQKEAADLRMKEIDRTFADIDAANSLVTGAVNAGYASPEDITKVMAMKDPAEQKEYSLSLISRGIQRARAESAAAAAAAAMGKAPDIKNFGTNDNPLWKQYNPTNGSWEDVSGLDVGAAISQEAEKASTQLSFLRNTITQAKEIAGSSGIIRTPVGPSAINRAIGAALVGNTSFNQLQNKTDTLKTNVLALMTDPSIRKFFGPQMSNADVQLIQSAGTTLSPMYQTKEEYVKELARLDELLGRMESAVSEGASRQLAPAKVIFAPDGTQIEIID